MALYYRGFVENQTGHNDRAEAYFQRALEVFPGFPTAHYSLGLLAFEQDAYPEALSRFRKVIALDPDHANAHNAAGIVLILMGDPDASREAFEEALRLEPDHPEARQNLQQYFVEVDAG
jgi:Flp pilus assembly protein TadD